MNTGINPPAGGQKKKMFMLAIGFAVGFVMLFGGTGAANAATSSGWETEKALVGVTPSWPVNFAIPYLAYNLKNDGKWILISGQEAYGGYFGYYWEGTQWVEDKSLVNGLSAHGWYEAPALAYNITGDNKWTLIGHQGSSFYGYYWDGTQWVEDSSRIAGLTGVSGRTSHTLIENLNGDSKWTLITGTKEGTFRAFSWEGTQWTEDSSKVNDLPDIGRDSRVTAGFNVTGNNKWTLIAVNYLDAVTRGFNWDNAQSKWIEDDSEKGLPQDTREMAPSLNYNLREDGKWVLISGYTKKDDMLGFMFDSIDSANLPQLQNVTSSEPLATTAHIIFSYPRTWDYRIKYSINSDMSNPSWSDWIKDEDNVDYKLRYLQPNTTYYYQVYAYVPWDTNYYVTSNVESFNTNPAQSYIFVNPGESIQDAIETLPLEGGMVELGEGAFTVNDTIRIWDNNITLKGQGIDKTIIEGGKIYVSRYDDFSERFTWLNSHWIKGEALETYSNESPEDFVHNVKINNLTLYNPVEPGIQLLEVWDNEISAIKVKYDLQAKKRGIQISFSRESVIQNSIFEKASTGIQLDRVMNVDVINNTIYDYQNYGIYYNNFWSSQAIGPTIAKSNKIIGGSAEGMFIYSGNGTNEIVIELEDNTVEGAGRNGIELRHGKNYKVIGNILRNNKPNGILISSKGKVLFTHEIRENLIYNNTENGISIRDINEVGGSQNVTVASNTIYNNGKNGIYNPQNHIYTIKNNIIVSNGEYGINAGANTTLFYNNIYNNTLGNYNGVTAGEGDISTDPFFADPTNADFHLKSTAGRWNGTEWVVDTEDSPAIDAGDPIDDYANEPLSNGGRINIGAYGNTTEASKTSTTENPTPILGDINNDNKVDINDFISLISKWLQTAVSPFDMNDDNRVNTRDLGIMMSNWKE